MARPTKKLNERQVIQVETLAAVLTMGQIAGYLGISETTLRQIRQRQPEVDAAYARGRAHSFASVGNSLLKQAAQGNVNAQKFYLETQAGWRTTQPEAPSATATGMVVQVVAPTAIDVDDDE